MPYPRLNPNTHHSSCRNPMAISTSPTMSLRASSSTAIFLAQHLYFSILRGLQRYLYAAPTPCVNLELDRNLLTKHLSENACSLKPKCCKKTLQFRQTVAKPQAESQQISPWFMATSPGGEACCSRARMPQLELGLLRPRVSALWQGQLKKSPTRQGQLAAVP